MELSNFSILYVDNVSRSVDFYRPLLEREPVEMSDGFALFVSDAGNKFGLWATSEVQPTVEAAQCGAMEVAFMVPDVTALQAQYSKWQALGVNILQAPTEMDFGLTFTVTDLDGHRLRVFCYEKTE